MVFGSVKGYGIQQISLKMLENKKWNFSELEIKDSDIKNEIKSVIENEGTVFALEKKKIFKAVYLFKLVNDSDDKYFVTINPEDLQSGVFELNQYYKVQLRFTGVGATNLTDSNQIAKWLIDNQQFFSEWSTVCLIKGIQKPTDWLVLLC